MKDPQALEMVFPSKADRTPTRFELGPAFSVAVAVAALAGGFGLVGAGVAWPKPRGADVAVYRGAELYASECASCHGALFEGLAKPTQPTATLPPPAPPLGVTGHAWRHSDAELAAIIAEGMGDPAPPSGTPGMPAFAELLGHSEIAAILKYVKSRWSASTRAYQATLNQDGEEELAAKVHDPTWLFPSQCALPLTVTNGF